MKILNSSRVSAFGGLNFVLDEFERLGIGDSINNSMPVLPNQSQYSWKISLRKLYGKENFWDLTSSGTDLYTWGSDARGYSFCSYTDWFLNPQYVNAP